MSISTSLTIKGAVVVGSGAQAVTFLHPKTGYLVKVARPIEWMEDQDILREALLQLLASVDGIAPKVYTWNNDALEIEMEYVPYKFIETVDSYLANDNWGAVRSLYYWAGVQLGKLHKLGLVHLDSHPKNWMVNEEGMPILIDYGFAQETDDATLRVVDYTTCLYGDTTRGKAYVGLLGIVNDLDQEDKDDLEQCFAKGYLLGKEG
jgi:serine/threonine protein kinase